MKVANATHIYLEQVKIYLNAGKSYLNINTGKSYLNLNTDKNDLNTRKNIPQP